MASPFPFVMRTLLLLAICLLLAALSPGAIHSGGAAAPASSSAAPALGPPPVISSSVHGPLPPSVDLSGVPDLSADPRPLLAALAAVRVNENGGQLQELELEAVLWLAGWPEELVPDAKAVSWCESRWSPWAVGDEGRSLGIFQLWSGWFDAFGVPLSNWPDPVANAAVALRVLEKRGRWGGGGGWSCAP